MTATEDNFTQVHRLNGEEGRGDGTDSSPRRLLQDGDLAALRNVLLAQERAQIKTLHHRLDDPATRAAEIARVLPEAIALRVAEDPCESLRETLAPVVRGALADALRENPGLLASAVRQAIGQSLLRPWRFCAALLRRQSRGRKMPARIDRLYLLDRGTGAMLEQIVRHADTSAEDACDARATLSMIAYLLAFLRDPEHLAGYAALRRLRIEHRTYGIFAGAGKVLLAVVEGGTDEPDIEGRLGACEQMLINAEQGEALPPLAE